MYQNALANGSWGAPIPENPSYQQRSGSEQESQGDYGSSDSDYDEFDSDEDEEDDGYAPLQMGAWGTQPTGNEADANAIQMPDWNARPTDSTPSLTFKADDWKKLCDPNVIVKSGIGSGNLHRKGANYIPVTEQQILNQRLKLGAPMPSGKKKSRGSKGKKPKGDPKAPKASKAQKVPKAHYPPPPPNGARLKAPSRPVQANSAWGQQLSSTPFWEQGGAQSSKYAPSTPPPPPPQQQQQQQKQPQQTRSAPPQSPASKWATQPLQENFTPPPPAQQQQPQKQPQKAPPPATAFGSAQSKYAPAQSKYAPAQSIPPPQPAQPAQPTAPVTPSYHGTISLTDQSAPTPPPRTTIFQLNIELIPGVSALLPVYETDDYTVLVKEFGAKHHLTIAPQAEFTFAEKIKLMVAELRKQQQQAQ